MRQKNLNLKEILIQKINKSYWWHVTPSDPNAYKKRGKFLASTYADAEFYGRPNDMPEKVNIKNPVFGFSDIEILEQIIPDYRNSKIIMEVESEEEIKNWYEKRIDVDAMRYNAAKKLGYDAIVLVCQSGYNSLIKNRKPHSIELNLFYI